MSCRSCATTLTKLTKKRDLYAELLVCYRLVPSHHLFIVANEYRKEIDAGKGAWEEGSLAFSFLPSLNAPRTHLIISINHNANTERLLCTSPVLLILTYSFLDRLVAVTIVVA